MYKLQKSQRLKPKTQNHKNLKIDFPRSFLTCKLFFGFWILPFNLKVDVVVRRKCLPVNTGHIKPSVVDDEIDNFVELLIHMRTVV